MHCHAATRKCSRVQWAIGHLRPSHLVNGSSVNRLGLAEFKSASVLSYRCGSSLRSWLPFYVFNGCTNPLIGAASIQVWKGLNPQCGILLFNSKMQSADSQLQSQPTRLITLKYVSKLLLLSIPWLLHIGSKALAGVILHCNAVNTTEATRQFKSKIYQSFWILSNDSTLCQYLLQFHQHYPYAKQKERNNTYWHLPQTVYKIYTAARTTHNHKIVKAV